MTCGKSDWRDRRCGVLSSMGWRNYCALPWCVRCCRWRADLYSEQIVRYAGGAPASAYLARVIGEGRTGGISGFHRLAKAVRNRCDGRKVQQPAWRHLSYWLALGGDGTVRGVVHHPGLHLVDVGDALERLAMRVVGFDGAPIVEVRSWVRRAVLATGQIEDAAQRDAVVNAGGYRTLFRRRGW